MLYPCVAQPCFLSLFVAARCRDNNRGGIWPYDELTLTLTSESSPADSHRQSHAGAQSLSGNNRSRHTLTCRPPHTHTHTHATRPRCPAMSLHSAGGHLLIVPCPQANTLHNWFISSQTPCSLVGSSCSLSLWRCGFEFCIHALNLP